MTKLAVGDLAPEFNIEITNGKTVGLSDFKGKYLVVYFYTKDNTPGCTIEAKGFNSLKNEFDDLGAEILGISKDSISSHDKFCDKYGLNFHLGSDVDGEICQKFGTWVQKSMFGKKYMGIQRATFLINPEGKIEHIWPSVSVSGHAEEVLDKIKAVKLT
jgi:peroxiredoxin Q/BCP